jgi:hypothetical protein
MTAAIEYSIFGSPRPGQIHAEVLESDEPIEIDAATSVRTSVAVWNAGPDAVEVFDDDGHSMRVGPVNGVFLMSPTGSILSVRLAR